jgi:hypothetical protein
MLTLDGLTKSWYMTWEPPWGCQDICVIEHEMGHGFGLPHSSGAYGQTYDNQWDVMSNTWSNCGCSRDATFGCLGQHTISCSNADAHNSTTRPARGGPGCERHRRQDLDGEGDDHGARRRAQPGEQGQGDRGVERRRHGDNDVPRDADAIAEWLEVIGAVDRAAIAAPAARPAVAHAADRPGAR